MDNESSTPISSLSNNNDNVNNDNNKNINEIINKIEKDNEQIKQEVPQQNDNSSQKVEEVIEDYPEEESYSVFDMIYNEVSYPILVAVIYVILSFTKLDDLMCTYIKFICNETGDINFFGTLLKSIILLLFYIFGKYVV